MIGARAFLGPVGSIFRKEIVELLRDLRAIFFALVLPLFLGPLSVWAIYSTADSHREALETRTVRVGVSGSVASFASVLAETPLIEIVDDPAGPDAVRKGDLDLLVVIDPRTARDEQAHLEVFWRSTSQASIEARNRFQRVLDRWERDLRAAAFRVRDIAFDEERFHSVDRHDISTEAERSAAYLARVLPALLVLLVLSGGSFAAIDLIAGEKERGTLETLAVQSITRGQIVAGKFLVVIAVAAAAVLLNLLGMVLSYELGWLGAGGGEATLGLSFARLGIVALVTLPMIVLLSAALLGISAHARSFREAQVWLFPVTLVALLPAGLALVPQARLGGLLAWVPLAGSALAIRDTMTHGITGGALASVLVATSVWATLALVWAARTLRSETILLGIEPPPLASDQWRAARERRAILLGIGMLVLVYYLGSWLQTRSWISFELGLLATLWGVVALPAILYALLAKKRAKELLGLHVPRVADGIAAFAIAFAAILLMASWSSVQETILPVPSAVREEFERMRTSIAALGPVTAFLVLALSPGIAEELFWRGAFQGELEARGRPVRVVAWSALFFGLFHLSIYRFVPTAFMGGLLAIVRLRTGSVIPCMVLHTTYNALNLFVVSRWTEAGLELGAWLVPVLILLLVLGLRALGPRRTRATAD